MATLKQVYVASDNTSFDTEEAANAHEALLSMKVKLVEYCAAAGLSKAETTNFTNHVIAFDSYVNGGPAPTPKVKKPRKPRAPKPAAAVAASQQ